MLICTVVQWYHDSNVDHVVVSNLIGQWTVFASQIQGLGTRLASLFTQTESGTSSGPTAGGVSWCEHLVLKSIDIIADQYHSDDTLPQYRYRMELVWRFVVLTEHVQISTFKSTRTNSWISLPLPYYISGNAYTMTTQYHGTDAGWNWYGDL